MAPITTGGHGQGAKVGGANNFPSSTNPSARIAANNAATSIASSTNQIRNATMAAPSNRGRNAVGTSNSAASLRNSTSTSSLRAKNAMSAGNAGPSKSQITQTNTMSQQSSLFSSLPIPSFPILESSTVQISQPQLSARLLQLAHSYIDNEGKPSGLSAHDISTADLTSASFYAMLALNCDPSSVPARRLLAATLLQGAQPFPFGPSVIHSLSVSSNSINGLSHSSAIRSGAHAAIELLECGSQDIFLDPGCARIFASACTALGRLTQAEEVLSWTIREEGKAKDETSLSSSNKVDLPNLMINSDEIQKGIILSDLGRISARTNRYDEAKIHLGKARQIDPWNWSAWVGLCDVGAEIEQMKSSDLLFPASQYEPRTFYAKHLERLLFANGYDKDSVSQAISTLVAQGDEYYTQKRPSPSGTLTEALPSSADSKQMSRPATNATTNNLATRSQVPSQTNGSEEMMRTTSNKRTVAQAITPSSTTSSLARPGSRTEATTASKRMRTMPSQQSTQQNTKPVTALNVTRPTNTSRPNDSSIRPLSNVGNGKGKPVSATTRTTASSVRMTGTLSASRTNEQVRPASVASASSKSSGNGDEVLKGSPRRSARVAAPGEAQKQDMAQATIPERQAQRTTVATRRTVASRPGVRPLPTSSSSSSDAEMAPSNAAKGRSIVSSQNIHNVNTSVASLKALNNIVQTAVHDAAEQAMKWTSLDAQISELVRTIAKAYQAVRNSRGRLALALLRPRGPLSKRDAEDVIREAVLSVPENERDQLRNQSIQVYGGLSSIHRNCADIQCLLGRAYHDLGRYHLAEKHFLHARHLSPSSISHMDIFSLSLFHLQREVKLSKLAKELALLDPSSCMTHIAAGNAYALQYEHAAALRCFQRACAAAPKYAYAFTLAGYEANELGDKEKSMQYFREAIKIEKRHWNAYAGLGQIHLQEEKLTEASYYYGQALEFHRSNSVLWDVYGRVKMAQGILGEAERAFDRALRLDNTSAMSHIKMAETLLRRSDVEHDHSLAQKQRDRAHNHLLQAVKIAPDEAHVHLMLAKSYMDKGSGTFATLLRNGNRNPNNNDVEGEEQIKEGPEEVSLSDLAQIGSGPIHLIMQQQQQIRATGHAILPVQYRAEIAKHLSTAIDLNPRLARYVKAMGEGARAALRGAAARLTGDNSALSTSFLVDHTGMTTEGLVDSMLELEEDTGEDVLEDPVSDSEEVVAVYDQQEEMSGELLEGEEEDQGGDHYDELNDIQDGYEIRSSFDQPSIEYQNEPIDGDNDIISRVQTSLFNRERRLRRQRSQLGLGLTLPQRTPSAASNAPPLDSSEGTDYEQDVSMSF